MKVIEPHDFIRQVSRYLEAISLTSISEAYGSIAHEIENKTVSELVDRCIEDIKESIDILENQDPTLERKVQVYKNLGATAYMLSMLVIDYTSEEIED